MKIVRDKMEEHHPSVFKNKVYFGVKSMYCVDCGSRFTFNIFVMGNDESQVLLEEI